MSDDHRTVEERVSIGRAARAEAPRSSHADWSPAPDRPDPVEVTTTQDEGRLAALVPIRHGRMLFSPLAFYRGSAAIMAADLAGTPTSAITVQACGDAHLSNFGVFASPERTLVFDVNDFDETLPGPWEWDVKRLAASFVIAGRNNGFDHENNRAIARRSVRSYQRAMSEFAAMPTLDVWYARVTATDIEALAKKSEAKKRVGRTLAKARRRDSLSALSKLAVEVDGRYQIRNQPPVVFRLDQADDIMNPAEATELVREGFAAYLDSLSDDRRALLTRYRLVDIAHKVVGVGSVGTRCLIALLEGRDRSDPLFLQAKEAGRSVLEDHLPATTYELQGRRIVEGQRLTQAASDIFLGWARGRHGRDFYFRQLRDMKGSAAVETMELPQLSLYADLCGWTLARAHARSGDPVAIASYLGSGGTFADAVAEFAHRYADQNDLDYAELQKAVADGRLESAEG